MVKNVKWVFVVLVFSSLISLSFDRRKVIADELSLGAKAPELVLCNEKEMLNLQLDEGKYTLVSFWASYDAASREKNASLCHMAEKDIRIRVISISFDHYESVFKASIGQDKGNAGNYYLEKKGKDSDIYKSYGLKNGFTNYLLNNEGIIIAKDVTADKLSELLK